MRKNPKQRKLNKTQSTFLVELQEKMSSMLHPHEEVSLQMRGQIPQACRGRHTEGEIKYRDEEKLLKNGVS